MKHAYIVCSTLFFLIVLLSCNNKQKNIDKLQSEETELKQPKSLVEVDLLEEYPKKKIKLQDVAEVTYIPFETHDNGLLREGDLVDILWQGDTIIIYNNNTINFFNRNGKFLSSFNRQGGSNEEYNDLFDMTADFNAKEIYVYDIMTARRILVYSFNGTFIKSFSVPENLISVNLFDFDADFLFCEDGSNIFYTERPINSTPYFLISKKTGEFIPLPIHITERIGTTFIVDGINIHFDIEPVMKTNDEIIVSDFSLDTVYSLRNRIPEPTAIRKNIVSKNGHPFMSAVEARSKKYILWGIQERNVDIKKNWIADKRYVLLNLQNGEISEVEMINTDFLSSSDMKNFRWNPGRYQSVISGDCIIQPLGAPNLIELYKQGRLSGRLKEIASELQEEDNPVLTLIKFKE